MATQPKSCIKRISSSKDTEPASVEELVRLLVNRIVNDNRLTIQQELDIEEVMLDIDVDGARYLIVRLPKFTQTLVVLSPREQEIARMVANGYQNKTIAAVLNISSWTVGTHLRRIFTKLGVNSRASMVAHLLEKGIVKKNAPSGVRRELGPLC